MYNIIYLLPLLFIIFSSCSQGFESTSSGNLSDLPMYSVTAEPLGLGIVIKSPEGIRNAS